MNNRKKIFVFSAFIAVFILSIIASYVLYRAWTKPEEEKIEALEPTSAITLPKSDEAPTEAVIEIKDSVQISVPYTVQAPYANWAVHEESCEEAAALMYHYFLTKESFPPKNTIPADKASAEMITMKNWQKANYGFEPDLSIEKFGEFIKAYYGHSYTVSKNITKEDIQRALSKGSPVIVPVITHGLENPRP